MTHVGHLDLGRMVGKYGGSIKMMKTIGLFFTCMIFAFWGCMEESSLPTPSQVHDEGEFISSFLNLRFSLEDPMGIPFIIEENLVMYPLQLLEWSPSFSADLVKEAEGHGKKLVEAVQDFCGKHAEND